MQFLNTTSAGDGLLQRVSEALGPASPTKLTLAAFAKVQLTQSERSLLIGFHQQRGGVLSSSRDDVLDGTARATLFDILTSPIDVTTRAGKDAESIRMLLGIRNVADTTVHEGLQATYGPQHLAGSFVFYNGHATNATLSLFPMLGALGLREIGFNVSNYSGDKGVQSLFNTLLNERLAISDGSDIQLRFMHALKKNTNNPIILVNAGKFFDGKVSVPDSVLQRIIKGEIRFVMHNAADKKALAKLCQEAIIIDIADSEAKKLEAQVIGEQWAVHCGQAALDHLGVPLKESFCIVKGAGLIGSNAVRGLIAFGYPSDRIVVIDTDHGARHEAMTMGIKHTYAKTPMWLSSERHGVLLVATNGTGLTGADVDGLPKHTVALATTTAGGGIDIPSLQARLPCEDRRNPRFLAHGMMLTDQNIFEDLSLSESNTGQRVTLVNCRYDDQRFWRAYPPNLLDTVGQMALVTSSMINVAVCEAVAETRPGLRPLSAAGEELIAKAFRVSSGGPLIAGLIPSRLRAAVLGLDGSAMPRSLLW